ncbi:MAG TPA: cell division protein ZipA C-terminal FtsZ-binding domain-containing protein [Candidatus Dormibacteraeota bacterium]|nr:cell division protein ZipA C-terminal FtsZ-binding domain-containing protein [Candidatus Dormibacteraeota bacterium]
MMALGLEWGDMDLFHWVNGSDNGDDSFFRVWTSTAPGYFLPEEIGLNPFSAMQQ